MSDRTDLIEKANSLGLEFPGNVKSTKLQEMIDESSGKESKIPQPDSTETLEKPDEVALAPPVAQKAETQETGKVLSRRDKIRRKVAKAKKAATKFIVVTLTNKDPRENSTVTTQHLSVENQHFSVSRIVPLDIPVQLEQCLVDQAESTMMTLHKDEVIAGKRTGNKVAIPAKKFVISYAKNQSEE